MPKLPKPLDEYTLEQLKDPTFRRAFLKESLEADDPRVFLKALQLAIKASDVTVKELAETAGVSREHFYRALSDTGNPSWSMVYQVLHGLGYDLSLKNRKRA